MKEKDIEKEIRKLVSIHDTSAISGSPNVKDDDEWISLGQSIFLIKQKDKETRKKVEWLKEQGICNVCFKKPIKECIRDNHVIVVNVELIDKVFEDVTKKP